MRHGGMDMGIGPTQLRPDLRTASRVLVVAPHQDDATIGAGATLADLASGGARVVVVDITNGDKGSIDPEQSPPELAAIRQDEERAATAILGLNEVRFLDFPDFAWLDERAVTLGILREIRLEKPDALFFPDPWLPDEGHPDHRTVGLAAAAALVAAGLPHVLPEAGPAVSSPFAVMYATGRPNLFWPAGAFWERKRAALQAHQSQFTGALVDLLMAYWAEQSASWKGGKGPKEAFRLVSALLMHMAPQIEIGKDD